MVAQIVAAPPGLIEVGEVVPPVIAGALVPGKARAPWSVMEPLATPSSSVADPSVRTMVMDVEVLLTGVTVMHPPLGPHLTQTALDALAPDGRFVGRVTVTVALPPTGTVLMVKVKKPRGKVRPELEENAAAPAGVVA